MNKTLLSQIKVRAKWLAMHYTEFNVDDLIQEASLLCIKLRKHSKDLPNHYLIGAVNNLFMNKARDSNATKRIRLVDLDNAKEIPDLGVDRTFEAVENQLDREKFLADLKDKELIQYIRDLEEGFSPKEIAQRHKTSVRTIYRKLSYVKTLREEWEKK